MSGEMSSRHNAGKRRRGGFASRNPVWRDEDVWAGAGSSEQAGLMDEPSLIQHKLRARSRVGQGWSSGSGVRPSSWSCPGAMATASRRTALDRASSHRTRPGRAPREPGILPLGASSVLTLPLQGRLYRVSFCRVQFLSSADAEGQLRHPLMPSLPWLPW